MELVCVHMDMLPSSALLLSLQTFTCTCSVRVLVTQYQTLNSLPHYLSDILPHSVQGAGGNGH